MLQFRSSIRVYVFFVYKIYNIKLYYNKTKCVVPKRKIITFTNKKGICGFACSVEMCIFFVSNYHVYNFKSINSMCLRTLKYFFYNLKL